MQLVKYLRVALLVASQAIAAPITEPELLISNAANDLIKRADPAPMSCERKLNLQCRITKALGTSQSCRFPGGLYA